MGKLVLSRQPHESIRIITADGLEIVVTNNGRERTSLAIDAPPSVRVLRGELDLKRPLKRPHAA